MGNVCTKRKTHELEDAQASSSERTTTAVPFDERPFGRDDLTNMPKLGSTSQDKDDHVVSESLLQDVAKQLLEWRFLGRKLGIPEGMLNNIECDNVDELERKYKTLLLWKHQSSSQATIVRLANALREVGRADLADDINEATDCYSSETGQRTRRDGKTTLFIQQLKRIYKVLYNSVRPLPYVKGMMCCVDKVFIEGNIETLVTDERGNETWKPLQSYHEMVSELDGESTRRIILGDPGYGKSTLALQFLYDWCNEVPESPLKEADIVIFLRMRQLGGFTSIYEAIKCLLLPKDSHLTVDDIKAILQNRKSTVIILDGYDEYPDKGNMETDFIDIMKMRKFDDTNVIVSSRLSKLSQLPDELKMQSTQFQLKGFDSADRCSYILKAVVGGNTEEGKTIIRQLTENSVLHDMCQIPFFFTIVAHTAQDKKTIIPKNKSVTWFFRYIMECFCFNTTNKNMSYTTSNSLKLRCEQLGKISYQGLSKTDQQIVWDKRLVLAEIDDKFYNNLLATGILIEEDVTYVADSVDAEDFFQEKTMVIFYHKLFCEWYAAQYLVACILRMLDVHGTASATRTVGSSIGRDIYELLSSLDPTDLQYLFRFASGRNAKVGHVIINYLVREAKDKKLAILCVFEYTGDDEDIQDAVKDICSDAVFFREFDNKILHRSTIQLLWIASRCDIPISELILTWSFRGLDGQDIKLDSGLCLPTLSSLEKLVINGDGQQLSEEEVIGLIRLNNCIMPLLIRTDRIPHISESRDVKVMSSADVSYLDLKSGKWKTPDDIKTITEMCSDSVTIHDKTSEAAQRSVIELLVKASKHDIRLYSLSLIESFKAVDKDGCIILNSGLSVPTLATLESLMIQAETGREMNQQEVNGILDYVQQCPRCKMLILHDCLLPFAMRVNQTFSRLQSQSVDVVWVYIPNNNKYLLDLSSGNWLKSDKAKEIMTARQYEEEVERYRELYRDYPWQKARIASGGKD